jgi:hypothetical protein
MLRYDAPADAPTNRPVRRLLVLVLLMAIRDRANQVRFCLHPDQMSLWYRVDGTWHELVPPPAAIWPGLVAEVRRLGRFASPEVGTGWWSAIRRAFARPAGLAAGWLTFRHRGQDQLYAARLDPGPVRGEISFEAAGPAAIDPESATAALGEMMRHQGGDLYVEFEFPPDAGK